LLRDGAPAFPNATLHVHEADFAFWNNAAIRAATPPDFQGFIDLAVAVSNAYAGRIEQFKGDVDVAPGIRSVELPGHTPGHVGYIIDGGSDSLFVWGDIVHAPVWQFAKPDVTIAFDVDPAQAIITRKRTMDMVATDNLRIAGIHIDYPGIGFAEKHGDGYRFTPESQNFTM